MFIVDADRDEEFWAIGWNKAPVPQSCKSLISKSRREIVPLENAAIFLGKPFGQTLSKFASDRMQWLRFPILSAELP